MKLVLGCVFTSSVIEIAGRQIAVTNINVAADGSVLLAVWREESGNVLCAAIKLPELCKWFLWLVYRCSPSWRKRWQSPRGRGVPVSSRQCHLRALGLSLSWNFSLRLASRSKWNSTDASVWKQECSVVLTYHKYFVLINLFDSFLELKPLTKITAMLSALVVSSSLSHIRPK